MYKKHIKKSKIIQIFNLTRGKKWKIKAISYKRDKETCLFRRMEAGISKENYKNAQSSKGTMEMKKITF